MVHSATRKSQTPVVTGRAWGKPVQADIDLSAIASNVRAVKSLIGPRRKVMAVVKADGYGLGAPWVAAAALEGGASWLGVARVDEGVQLRRAGYSGPILVMSHVAPDEARAALNNRLTLTLHRAHTAYALQEAAAQAGLAPGDVPVHIKIDTGLGRYGCHPRDFLDLVAELSVLPHIRMEGLMTHFADADALDLSFVRSQLATFNNVQQLAALKGVRFDLVHAANSAATLALPEARFDMVRIGILLSGHVPAAQLKSRIALTHALTLRSRLARVFEAEPGDTVGYGRTWTAQERALVGNIPIGYADGYFRSISNLGEVLVRGVRCPVIGRVSMDQIGVDLTALGSVAEGEEVVLIGKQGEDEITADEVAGWAGTISYEVLCALSERVPRRYLYGGEPVDISDLLGRNPVRQRMRKQKEMSR